MAVRQRAIHAEDKQQRRDAILDAAEQILLGAPERVASVSEVAKRAGLAKGTVYLYFPSKAELLLAVHERRVECFIRDLIDLVESGPRFDFDTLFALIRTHLLDRPLFLPPRQPATDHIRPVLLTQVVPESGAQAAVFSGEVKPRYESDLAFRIGGKIVARTVDAGARVRKDQVLARLDALKSAEQITVVLVAEPDTTYRGKVRAVSPGVDPVTRTFSVRILVLDSAPAVQWGMTAKVSLAEGRGAASLLPATALYQALDGRPAIWVYDPEAGKVSLRPVVVAQFREDGVVIADGLAAGEWVVATGANKLHEGQRVRPYAAGGRPIPPRHADPGEGPKG